MEVLDSNTSQQGGAEAAYREDKNKALHKVTNSRNAQ